MGTVKEAYTQNRSEQTMLLLLPTGKGSLEKYSVDLELGGNNDFELQMNVKNHCMSAGCIWYVKDEEYGGIVDDVKVDTEKSKVYYSGRSWRGVLEKKVIRPDTGKDYLTVFGDVHDILSSVYRGTEWNQHCKGESTVQCDR